MFMGLCILGHPRNFNSTKSWISSWAGARVILTESTFVAQLKKVIVFSGCHLIAILSTQAGRMWCLTASLEFQRKHFDFVLR